MNFFIRMRLFHFAVLPGMQDLCSQHSAERRAGKKRYIKFFLNYALFLAKLS